MIEDFSTYEEFPASRLTITSTKATVVDLTRDETVYLVDDKGVNHFSEANLRGRERILLLTILEFLQIYLFSFH